MAMPSERVAAETRDAAEIEAAETIEEELEIAPLEIDPLVDTFPPVITATPSVNVLALTAPTADILVPTVTDPVLDTVAAIKEPLVVKVPKARVAMPSEK